MASCPKCGSENFRYELWSAGTCSKTNYYKTGIKDSWILPAGRKTYKSQRRQKAVGFCPNCGYIDDKQSQQKSFWFYVLCFLFWPITLSIWFYKTDKIKMDRKIRLIILAVFWLILMIAGNTVPKQ